MLPLCPSIIEIEAMAFNREDRALYALFETGKMLEWEQYSLEVFYAIVRGAEIGLAEGKRSQTVMRRVAPVIDELFQRVITLPTCPRIFFIIIDRWTAILCQLEQHTTLIPFLEFALEHKVSRYPGIEVAMQLRLAEALSKIGKLEKAHALYMELAQRPYRIQNTLDRYTIAEKGALSALATGLPVDKNIKTLLWHSRSARVARLYRGIVNMLLSREGLNHAKIFIGLARLGEVFHRIPGMARLFALLRRIAVFIEKSFFIQQHYNLPSALSEHTVPSCASTKPKPILVTRAMGGLGDLLMMTPGLAALKAKYPERDIHFAIPQNFHMLFEGNTDVLVKDIHGLPLVREDYHAWYDLTDCPAAKVESLTAPNVKKNRIELFAKGMGISKIELAATGYIPSYHISKKEHQWATGFLHEHIDHKYPLLGIQLYSADEYRDYPHMPQLIKKLTKNYFVLLFHGERIEDYKIKNVVCIDSQPFRKSAAILGQCELLIAPDSSLIHLAPALGVPVIALTGPVCGKLRTSNYPKAQFIDERKHMPCVPCWRNENLPCQLTGKYTSECLNTLPVTTILQTVDQMLRNLHA